MEPNYLFDEEEYYEKYYPDEKLTDYDPDNIEHYIDVIDEKKRRSLL